MILLFTDFGWDGPYVGQLHLVLAQEAPGVRVIDLQHDAPAFSPPAAGHLLAALSARIPAQSIVVAVVDPGVGSQRPALLLKAGGRYFIGPDNGLLAAVAARSAEAEVRVIDWRPAELSDSFHGRDLFAPLAARLALGEEVESRALALSDMVGARWPALRPEVIYIDAFGNCWSGIAADLIPAGADISIDGQVLPRARTFSAMEKGRPFWYVNSAGLAEIAVNQGSAANQLGLAVGAPVCLRPR